MIKWTRGGVMLFVGAVLSFALTAPAYALPRAGRVLGVSTQAPRIQGLSIVASNATPFYRNGLVVQGGGLEIMGMEITGNVLVFAGGGAVFSNRPTLNFNQGDSQIFDDGQFRIATDDFLYLNAPNTVFVQNNIGVGGGLSIAGLARTGNLNVSGDATIGDDISIGDDATVTGTLTVGTSTVTIDGNGITTPNLTVTGTATLPPAVFAGYLPLTGGTITGDLTVQGNLDAESDLTVSGDLTAVNDLGVGGDITVDGDINVVGGITADSFTGDGSGLTHLTETDPVYSANSYAVGMNQGVATTDSPTFVAVTTSSLQTAGALHLQPDATSSDRVRLFRNTTGNPLFNIWGYDTVDATQKYITIAVFDNPAAFTEAGASSRAIITSGGNTTGTRNALELQSPDQIRITAVDNVLNQGDVRIAADTYTAIHSRTDAETDAAKYILFDTVGDVQGGNPTIETNTGDLVLAPAGALTVSSAGTFIGPLTASSFSGNLTGNVTGNLFGNAATATLATSAATATTAADLVAASSVVSDAEVDDNITASNYLPLAGGDINGVLRTINDNATSFRLRGVCDGTTDDNIFDSNCQSYAGVFYNPVFNDTGGTGARTTRVIYGSNEDMDLELQGSNHIRITAVDNNVGNGRIRLAAEDEIQLHAGVAAETDNLIVTVKSTGITLAMGKDLTVVGGDVDFSGAASFRVPVSASDPFTCDSSTKGVIYFNTTDSHFYGCTGAAYVRLDNSP